LLGTVCPKDNFAGQLGLILKDALKIRAEKAKDELKKLIHDKNRPPTTFNHYLNLNVNKTGKSQLSESETSPEKRQKVDTTKSFCRLAAQGDVPFGIPDRLASPKTPLRMEDDSAGVDTSLDVGGCVMEIDEYSCLDALDYLNSYYMVQSTCPME
jgi:hypothetical protein